MKCTNEWNRTEIFIDYRLARGKTSKSSHGYFLAISVHNVNFPGKLERFTGIFFYPEW